VSLSVDLSPATANDLSQGRIRRAIRTVRRLGLAEVVALARRHGLRKCLAFAGHNIRHIVAHRLALRWDRAHGVDTAGSIQLDALTIDTANRQFGNECVCTSPRTFGFIMRSLPRELSDYTFVDIGAGKSRTLLLASHYSFAKVVGVEFATELVACSRANIARFRSAGQKCRDIEVVEGDAAEFAFPETPLVIYFYNPFTRDVFDTVLNNIAASLTAAPRDCYVVYGSSSHNAIDWARPAILGSGLFDEVPRKPMPFFADAVRTVRYAVFRTR
jgi:hypothetical protein